MDEDKHPLRNINEKKDPPDQASKASHSQKKKAGVHRILGGIYEELLTPLDIIVNTDLPVMSLPPEADILLLRRKAGPWTKEQLKRIPDGIRRVKTQFVLIEFKYTESVNLQTVKQADQYEALYARSQKLKPNQISTFLVSSKTPRKSTLDRLEYVPTKINGVYQGTSLYNRNVSLILCNELDDTSYNAALKLFSGKKRQAIRAFRRLTENGFQNLPKRLQSLIAGSRRIFFKQGGNMIQLEEITVEEVEKIGRDFITDVLPLLSPDDIVETVGEEMVINAIGEDKVINAIGEDKVINAIGEDKVINTIGEDKVINTIGKDKVIDTIGKDKVIDTIGKDKVIDTIGKDKVIDSIGKDEFINRFGKENLLKTFSKEELKEALKKKNR